MSYLPSKKRRTQKILSIVFGLVLLFTLLVWTPLLSVFGVGGIRVGAFFFNIGTSVSRATSNTAAYFMSKQTLSNENKQLSDDLAEARVRMRDRDIIAAENKALKALMERTDTTNFLLAAILAKPNQSPYDTLIIDVGENQNVHAGDDVYADGTVLIGRVSDVYGAQSKVTLFSTSGQQTVVRFTGSDADLILNGRGGGTYEIDAPKGFSANVGDTVFAAGIHPALVAEVAHISDDSGSSRKIYLRMPVSMFSLNWVEIQRHASVQIQH